MKDSALWERIQRVEFADTAASLDFVGRLMRENRWSRSFALSAVAEYRRFAYLALVCEHEVTPSDEVDQVWHLHLLYTRHYWGEWTDALGRALHHGPTRGGASEADRFDDNYTRTLASYHQEFSEPAPALLWPDGCVRFSRPLHFVRLNTADFLLLPRRWVQVGIASAGVAALSVATGRFVMAQSDSATGTVQGSWLQYALIIIALALGFMIPWSYTRYRAYRASKDRRQGTGGCSGNGCSGMPSRDDSSSADSGSDGVSGCSGCGGGD